MNALAKVIAKEIAKTSEEVRDNRNQPQKISFLIKGEAVVKQGEDYEQVVNQSVPYEKLVAVLFSKLNGVTMESVVREALESDLKADPVKEAAVEALNAIKGKQRRKCSGKVTFDSSALEISEIDICEFC